mgnify:CR=1 FL=1
MNINIDMFFFDLIIYYNRLPPLRLNDPYRQLFRVPLGEPPECLLYCHMLSSHLHTQYLLEVGRGF